MVRDDDRCLDITRKGVRCQLFTHVDNQHVAMVDADPAAPFERKWVFWGTYWTGPIPGEAPIRWAATFPRVES